MSISVQPHSEEADASSLPVIAGVPRGAEAMALARLAEGGFMPGVDYQGVVYVAVNDRAMDDVERALAFYAPGREVLRLPAWDCLPYDRVSAHSSYIAPRVQALARLAAAKGKLKQVIVLTTVNALLQKLPPQQAMEHVSFTIEKNKKLHSQKLIEFLIENGYRRAGKVMEPGEFAVRGGIIDLFPPGEENGVRIDLFGDDIESLRIFEPLSQVSSGHVESVTLHAAGEILLNEQRIQHFRQRYRELFGAVSKEDALYEAVSAGQHFPGMEHWMPLFYERMETLFSYAPHALFVLEAQADKAIAARQDTIQDYYDARLQSRKVAAQNGVNYNPVPPEEFYLVGDGWANSLQQVYHAMFSPFIGQGNVSFDCKAGYNFADVRTKGKVNVFEALHEHVSGQRSQGRSTIIACASNGTRERLATLLANHQMHAVRVEHWGERKLVSGKSVGLAVLPSEYGFEGPGVAIISEQELLGERILRGKSKKRTSEMFLAEAANFIDGELVVHKEHGIGRFEGLETLEVSGAKHDCLKLVYEGGDKLFLPVENIELVSRYGAEDDGAKLDKLGGASWQARKARLKERIKIAAEALMKTAAERALREADAVLPDSEAYAAFCDRFPYAETDDQDRSITEVLEDMASGKPMDRLVCGDVGFGKTEVALRAAFAATHQDEGKKMQVAVVVPTTLLARQHYKNFKERFAGFNVEVRQLSRMVPAKEQAKTREMMKDGTVDIVVGTHALLGKKVEFKNLGLVIIDEEQHFGVGQKEKLKELKADVHVLTLSATPIPRTLQMAMSGVRELSLITTPPVDRLAIRSFVMPLDAVILREAILREQHRNGRVFVVTPRIKDIPDLKNKITQIAPEARIVVAHGQMPPSELDDVMNQFYDGKYDLLISTAIIESGLDIPTANTMIIHRADMFGLAQLYQLRGRVGRGKIRAYAYFLLPPYRELSRMATKRLEVMQTLDTLGAGFSLASHDMDIRGFGNLVGEEQSGHVREVGIELYQQMLEAAVQAAKVTQKGAVYTEAPEEWSPQINLGMSVLIPESYVADLPLRLGLYRRAALLTSPEEIDAFAAELVDRFGAMPEEVGHLLSVMEVKRLCRAAHVEKVDAGPKGAVFAFRENRFPKPEALLRFIATNPKKVKLRPDHKMVLMKEWKDEVARLQDVKALLNELVELAA